MKRKEVSSSHQPPFICTFRRSKLTGCCLRLRWKHLMVFLTNVHFRELREMHLSMEPNGRDAAVMWDLTDLLGELVPRQGREENLPWRRG